MATINVYIDRTLEMTSDGPTYTGKYVSLTIACARSQGYTYI